MEVLGEVSNDEVQKLMISSIAIVSATKLLEGQPTLLCEASILGKASIFPNTEGISEFFPPETKLSFQQYNYDNLFEKLNMLSQEDLLELEGKNNKKFIINKLNNESLINNFEKIINE